MTTKHDVIRTHLENPAWSAYEIALHLDCLPEYVRKTASRNGLTLPSAHARRNDPCTMRASARQLMLKAERLLERAKNLESKG